MGKLYYGNTLLIDGDNGGGLDNKITNCITEIPQDIKLELNNGTLTLKAGSKVYVPNGSGVFKEVIVQNNITTGSALGTITGDWFLFYSNGGYGWELVSHCYSGDTLPTGSGVNRVGYNTSTNKMMRSESGGAYTELTNYSFPVCHFSTVNGTITSINQVFNGFGYIGSTVFALPGVKGLIPNGRNADGSLKNIEFTIPTVKTITRDINGGEFVWAIKQDGEIETGYNYFTSSETQPTSGFHLWYKPSENIIYRINAGELSGKILACFVGSEYRNSVSPYRVERITPKTAFHAVDYSDAVVKSDWIEVQSAPVDPDPDKFYYTVES